MFAIILLALQYGGPADMTKFDKKNCGYGTAEPIFSSDMVLR